MRLAGIEAQDVYRRAIDSLEEMSRPKVVIGSTLLTTRAVSVDYSQPVGIRRTGFQDLVQHVENREELIKFDELIARVKRGSAEGS